MGVIVGWFDFFFQIVLPMYFLPKLFSKIYSKAKILHQLLPLALTKSLIARLAMIPSIKGGSLTKSVMVDCTKGCYICEK